MKIEELPNDLQSRFNHSYWAIYLYNNSLNELFLISDILYTASELKIANSHTFNFYRVTLHYCFVMEYNKLLETGRKDNTQNISSLIQLNNAILENLGEAFKVQHSKNKHLIDSMKNSEFYSKIRSLRDKKYGHADNDEINKPFSFRGFKTEDFENATKHLQIIKEIIDICTQPFRLTFLIDIPNREDRTYNFIRFHAKIIILKTI